MNLRTFAFKMFSLLVIIGMLVSNTAVALAQQPDPATPTPQAPAAAPGIVTPQIPMETPGTPAKTPALAGTSAPTTFTISGKVTGKNGQPLAGVAVSDDHSHTATTGDDGAYALPGLQPGKYVVVPKLAGQIFLPYYRVVNLADKDAGGVDFYVPKTDPDAITAPTNQPAGSPAYQPHPPSGKETQPANPDNGGVSAQAVYTVGAAGLAYYYAGQFGTTEQPYPVLSLGTPTYFNTPVGIAIDHAGNQLVAEEKGSRVVRLDSTGKSDLSIGLPGVKYTSDYVFTRLLGTAFQPDTGNIWAADNSRLAEYDADGTFILSFPSTDAWRTGSETDRFNGARGIAFNDDGSEMYVSDTYNNRVQVFDFVDNTEGVPTPHYLRSINGTEAGGGGNTFNNPWHLTYLGGYVYVADLWNNRIQRCDTDTTYCTTFELSGPAIEDRGLDLPTSIAFYTVTSPSFSFITDGRNQRVLRCDVNGENCEHFAGTPGEIGSDNAHFFWPEDISVSQDGIVYVVDKQNDRIRMFNAVTGEQSGPRGTTRVPYKADDDGSHLNLPTGVATTADSLYVAEGMGGDLVKYDNTGHFQWRSGEPGVSGVGEFTWWSGEPEYTGADVDHFSTLGIDSTLGADSHGRIYVPDIGNYRIIIYLPNGSVFDTIGDGWGNDNYHFNCPTGVAIRPGNDDIYVVDSCNQRIQIYDSARKYKGTIGQTEIWGSDSQHFNWPHGVAVDSSGTVYVADQTNNRVQKCKLSGSSYTCVPFAGVTGVGGPDFRDLNGPLGVTIGPDGLIYVAEQYQNRVEVFDPSGAYRTTLGGSWGTGSGNLRNPIGVAVDANYNVYVADSTNHRVIVYSRNVPNWNQLNVNGWGEQVNDRASGFVDYTPSGTTEEMLYSITERSSDSAFSPQVWRMRADKSWQAVSTPSFGDYNNTSLVSMKEFNGGLYVSTWNNQGAQIWSCSQASGCDEPTDWQNASVNGLSFNKHNPGIIAMQEYHGKLYIGTYSSYQDDSGNPVTDGAQLWSFDGANWSMEKQFPSTVTHPDPLFFIGAMTVFNNELVIGLASWPIEDGAELWTLNTYADPVVWTKREAAGITSTHNQSFSSLNVYGTNLYVGTNNPDEYAMIYRLGADYPTAPDPVVPAGFGQADNYNIRAMISDATGIYAVVENDVTGLQIWHSSSGAKDSWSRYLTVDGFGNNNNTKVDLDNSVIFFKGRMIVGAQNDVNGGGVWATDPSYAISGTVSGGGVGAGVLVTLNPGGRTMLTTDTGFYTFNKLFPGKYTVTPTKAYYTFSPVSQDIQVTAGNVTQNFTATYGLIGLISPANGAALTSLLPQTFAWAQLGGATKYTLQISTDGTFTASSWKTVTQAGTTYAASGLKPATLYYWHVRQASPSIGDWSARWSFTTPWPALAPALAKDPVTGLILPKDTFRITFNWIAAVVPAGAPPVQKYHVQISQKTTFDSLDLDEYTLDAGLSYTTPDLAPNRFYYWRVRAVNTEGAFGAWSSVRSFKTLPGKPILDWIENQDTLRPTFHWHDDFFTGKYTIQICKSHTDTTCNVFKSAPVTGTSYTLPINLYTNTYYAWRIQANGSTGAGSFTGFWDWWSPDPPAMPVLNHPLANEIIPNSTNPSYPQPDYNPTFSWLPSTGTTNYEIQASGDSSFDGTWMDRWTGTDTSFYMDWRFYSNTISWWRVRACGDNGCSLWTTGRKLIAKPDKPYDLGWDWDGAELTHSFWWKDSIENSASYYTVQLCKDAKCSSPTKTATANDRQISLVLSGNTEYYWRVRGEGAASGDWSDPMFAPTHFAPSAPGLIKPASGASTDFQPEFTWSAPTGSQGYELQVSDSTSFDWIIKDKDDLVDPTYDGFSFWGGVFYWRVRAQNYGYWSPWSAPRKFITPAEIQVHVIDPNGDDASGVSVQISGYSNVFHTGSNGVLGVGPFPPGTYTVTINGDGAGYLTQTQIVKAATGTDVMANFVRYPQPAAGTYRIVLSWPTPNPVRELDAHLWLPVGNNDHISWLNPGKLGGFPHAQDTYEFFSLSEVIDIDHLYDGKYVFAANQYYPASKSWSGSGVKVQIWDGSGNNLPSWTCYSPSGTGSWWYAFDMTVTGGVPTITCKGSIKTTSPAPYVDNTISGNIIQSNGRPLVEGVTIKYGIGSDVFGSDVFGSPYTITGIGSGTYTITPEKSGWSFNPTSRTVLAGSTGVNFIATPSGSVAVGGAPSSLAVLGDYVYLGMGGRLDAVNVANKFIPDAPGKLWIEEDPIQDIAIAGDYAFVAQGLGGLGVVNIADPVNVTDPVAGTGLKYAGMAQGKVGAAPSFWTNGGNALGVALNGPTAYVAADDRLYTVNVTDPTAPAIVGLSYLDGYGSAKRVGAVAGKYAYVVGDEGLWVYDVTNPTKPSKPKRFNTWADMSDILISGNHAYITYYDPGDDSFYLSMFNTDDPFNPFEENRISLPEMGQRVSVFDKTLYVADGSGGLLFFDLSKNSGDPQPLGTYTWGHDVIDVVALDNFAYVITGGQMQVINTGDPNEPTCWSSYP